MDIVKVCIITCYNQPDYIRARTLRAAARSIDGVDVVVVKNTHKGLLRYAEVFLRLLIVRFKLRPDIYLLTFRGYEMLLPVRLLTIGKPLIYDEFIHPVEWAVYEHKKLSADNLLIGLFTLLYRILVRFVQLVLTDTDSHADLSAGLTGIKRSKIEAIPVGADESVFTAKTKTSKSKNKELTVFYYGNMLPLHGLKYVIQAAEKLRSEPVRFVLIGGNAATAAMVGESQDAGANIEYKKWVEFTELPKRMTEADICLAGPFGGTYQSQYVITGKAYQYLAMGRPVIIGENKESGAFDDKKNALIVPEANASALADVIRWALGHRDELEKIGQSGQNLYRQKFSNEQLSLQLKDILARLSNS